MIRNTIRYSQTTIPERSQNEGVVIYYQKQLHVTYVEPPLSDANCLVLKLNADTCIVGIYRPPSYQNTSNFINSIDSLLNSLSSFKNVILCGDINIDIIPNTTDKRSYEYLNVLASHGILPGHTFPTHNKTCLDHTMVKTNLKTTCLVLETSITDHDAVAVGIHHGVRLDYTNNQTTRIDYQGLDATIQNINFQRILDCVDVDDAANLPVLAKS